MLFRRTVGLTLYTGFGASSVTLLHTVTLYHYLHGCFCFFAQEMKTILAGHALGDVVLKSKGKPLSFTVRQLLVDITADYLIRKSGGR
jgi:hypothetical protein